MHLIEQTIVRHVPVRVDAIPDVVDLADILARAHITLLLEFVHRWQIDFFIDFILFFIVVSWL